MRKIAFLFLCVMMMLPSRAENFATSLPVFTSGPHKDKYFVYEHENFTAWMTSNGTCWVQPMNQGKPVGRSFYALTVRPYTISPDNSQTELPMVTFNKFSEPKVIPKTGGNISFTGMLQGEIPFEVAYEIKGDTITASGGCKDHRKVKTPTQFRFLSRFANMPGLGTDPSAEDIASKCKGMELVVQFEKSRTGAVFPFGTTEKIDGFHLPMEYAIVRGTHAPRQIEFRPAGKDGILRGYIYGGNSLWREFVIQYIAPAAKSRPSSTRAVMIIR